jgi:capsular exopolysaccharide synthesis family protein
VTGNHSHRLPALLAEDLDQGESASGGGFGHLPGIAWRRRWLCLAGAVPVWCIGAVLLWAAQPSFTAHTLMAVSPVQLDLAATDRIASVEDPYHPKQPDVDGEIQRMTSDQALLKLAAQLKIRPEAGAEARLREAFHSLLRDVRERWETLAGRDSQASVASSDERKEPTIPAGSASSPDTPNPGFLELPQPAPAGSGSSPDTRNAAVGFLRQRLKVATVGKSATVDIAFSAHDPQLAADVTNAVAANYIAEHHEARTSQAGRAAAYLKQRAEQLLVEVNNAEHAAEAFRAANVLPDGRDVDQLKIGMAETTRQLAAARQIDDAAKLKLEQAEARVRAVGITGVLEMGTSQLDDRLRELAAQARARLAGSKADHGAGYPETRRAETEYATVQGEVVRQAQARLEQLRSEATIAHGQVERLETALQSSRASLDHLNMASVKLQGLEAKAKVSRAVYESILSRLKQTEQVGFNEATSWVISKAFPPSRPGAPNVFIIGSVTLLVGAAVGLALALLAEHRSSGTVLSAQHVAQKGLRPLGIVPDLGHRGSGALQRALVASATPNASAFSESIGSIFTSVMELGQREQACQVLLVTSSLPFEGKSTTATALAAKIASANKRVLLVDGDLRAPRLHRAFGIANAHGLTECLSASQDPSESIHADLETGISVLTAGPRHSSPQNLLRSPAFAAAIRKWRSFYDFILIDSPPVLPISDARIVVPLTDYCIFVTHWRKTKWSTAIRALTLLRESGANIAGIVVTKVNVKQLATYGFADSDVYDRAYHRYYARGRRQHA